jgi:hypothetical protein
MAAVGGRRLKVSARTGAVLLALLAAPAATAQPECEPSGELPPALAEQAGCHLVEFGITPLDDLGCGTYRGVAGGLYPDGARVAPPAHSQLGRLAALGVVPRDASGALAPDGRIGFASIGMSNTWLEFDRFVELAEVDPQRNPRVVLVNGAESGRTAEFWADPDADTWPLLAERLAAADLTPAQLQVIWIKLTLTGPADDGEFPLHAEALRDDLEAVVRIAKQRLPNLRIAYLSSRIRGYTTVSDGLNPEPYAYETGFAVKWLIEDQMAGEPALLFDPEGPSEAPWLAWGPYLWADGETPRSDGLTWSCSDLRPDFTHPAAGAEEKVAGLLLDFLHTEPEARIWYRLAPEPAGAGPLALAMLAALRRARRRHRAAPSALPPRSTTAQHRHRCERPDLAPTSDTSIAPTSGATRTGGSPNREADSRDDEAPGLSRRGLRGSARPLR